MAFRKPEQVQIYKNLKILSNDLEAKNTDKSEEK